MVPATARSIVPFLTKAVTLLGAPCRHSRCVKRILRRRDLMVDSGPPK